MSASSESASPAAVDSRFWSGRRVLLTGHTGFKGAWLALWLQSLGARVTGFSNGVPTEPSLFELARVADGHGERRGRREGRARARRRARVERRRGRHPHGRAVARAPLLRGTARDV